MHYGKIVLIAFAFLGVAGLLSAFVAPLEKSDFFAQMRTALLNGLPTGFDWTNYEYIKILFKTNTDFDLRILRYL